MNLGWRGSGDLGRRRAREVGQRGPLDLDGIEKTTDVAIKLDMGSDVCSIRFSPGWKKDYLNVLYFDMEGVQCR
jgi:hypothetical protein